MNQLRSFAIVPARVLVALIFLINRFGIIDRSFAVHEMIARGIPANLAPAFSMAGRLVEILAGAGLALGLYPEICALALIAFMIPITLMAHSFWLESGKLSQLQLVNFLKNLTMIGGLLFIASVSSHSKTEKAERIGQWLPDKDLDIDKMVKLNHGFRGTCFG
jgi:putative oxidoreductase